MNSLRITTIDGYSIELDIDGEITQCNVEKGSNSGSLEHLMAMGYLDDEKITVPKTTINKISKWAYSHGY